MPHLIIIKSRENRNNVSVKPPSTIRHHSYFQPCILPSSFLYFQQEKSPSLHSNQPINSLVKLWMDPDGPQQTATNSLVEGLGDPLV